MDNYILVGKIINTFGIKAELKVRSNFEFKERIFIHDFKVFVGDEKYEEIIETRRVHKNNDLILFKNYSNINEVIKYKGKNLYILRKDLKLKKDEYLLSDLIGFEVVDAGKVIGILLDYEINDKQTLLTIKGEKTFYIPKVTEFIKKIDLDNKKIITNGGSDFIL